MKVAVITPRFAVAGVPLAQIRFARALADAGHEVDLVIGHINPGFELPDIDDVKVIVLKKPRVRTMLLPLVRYLRTSAREVVFSAEDHLNVMVLSAAFIARAKAKISCASRVTPFDTYSRVPFTKRWFLKLAMRCVMNRADALTCVSKDMVEQYRTVFKRTRHVDVYNVIRDKRMKERMNEQVDEEWIVDRKAPIVVAAGSLVPWKGFADLIKAMQRVHAQTGARLLILGDGPLRQELELLVKREKLGDSVRLLGWVENPLKYFSRADVFVLSSYVEGMPNVLVEAMACGCTPVSTNCPTGPRELLEDGRYGYLVPVGDIPALAAGITHALTNPIPQACLNEAIRPFSAEEVVNRHFTVLGMGA